MNSTLRIGLQVSSIDPYWVEVRETIWRLCRATKEETPSIRTQSRVGLPAPDDGHPSDCVPQAAVELIEVDLPGLQAPDDAGTRVEELLALDLDALIAVPDSAATVGDLLARGLPVISLIHRDISHPLFTSPRPLSESAYLACRHLVEICRGQGRLLIVGGRYAASAPERSSSRVRAALDVLADSPEIAWQHLTTPWDAAGARRALQRAAPDLAGPFTAVFGLSDTLALLAHEVGAVAGWLAPDARIVGINGDPLAIMAVARGDLAATVATSAEAIACQAVDLARRAAAGQPLPENFSYNLDLVTRENVGAVALTKLAAIADMPSRLVGLNRRAEANRLTQLETSLAINQSLGSILDRSTLTHQIAELIRANYGYDHVQIFLWDEESSTLILDRADDAGRADLSATQVRIPLADSAALGHALLRNQPIFIPDTRRSHRFPADPNWLSTHSRVIVPIRYGARTVGVLDLHSCELNRHTQAELDALQVLADQLGVAMRNAQLYGDAVTARAEAEQASRLKTRLLANVSHELRTPLNVILGYSQSALGTPNPYGVDLPDELRTDLSHIRNAGEQLARLVNDMLDQAQADIGALEIFPEQTDMETLLRDVYLGLAESVRIADGVECRLELSDSLPVMAVDPLRLRQILLNLASNAAKFTEHGHITLGALVQGEQLHIWVEDTGGGISKRIQKHIFDPFVTTEVDGADAQTAARPRLGIGLGLSVANRLATLHGGHLQIESQPGCGTICHLYLPLEQRAGNEPAQSEPTLDNHALPLDPLLNGIVEHASDPVQRLALIMQEEHAAAITSRDISDRLGMSPDYASRLFRRETGMTPRQYLNRYRILQGQKLLRNSDASITEIATEVGFSDAAYFSRVFRKEVGLSPQSFRKNTN